MTGFSEECDNTFPINFSSPPDGNWALHRSFTGTYKIMNVKEHKNNKKLYLLNIKLGGDRSFGVFIK